MLQNNINETNLLNHYNDHIKYYSSIDDNKIIDLCLELSGLDLANKKILDIGCGDGRLLKILEQYNICDYVGVDYSVNRTNIAQKISTKIPKTIITSTIQDFLINNTDSFDVCFVFEVFEHLQEPKIIADKLSLCSNIIIGSVPVNMPYEAHLQIYKTKQDVFNHFRYKNIIQKGKHFYFYI